MWSYISYINLAPVGPPKVSLLTTSTTWVQITWKPPFNPENFTLGFGLTYQLLNSSLLVSTPRPKTTITNIDSYQTTFTLQPLLQGSQYRIVMYTITAQGTSPQSDQLLVTTQHSGMHACPVSFTIAIILFHLQIPMVQETLSVIVLHQIHLHAHGLVQTQTIGAQ